MRVFPTASTAATERSASDAMKSKIDCSAPACNSVLADAIPMGLLLCFAATSNSDG